MERELQHIITYRTSVYQSDIPHITRILQATSRFYPEEIDIALELINEKIALDATSSYQFIFAQYQDYVVGYICYGKIPLTKASFDIYWIAVDPQFQGKHIGYTLLQLAEEDIKSHYGKHIYIETSGRSEYTPTHAFYIKMGYSLIATFKDFYADGDDKLVFYKNLSTI